MTWFHVTTQATHAASIVFASLKLKRIPKMFFSECTCFIIIIIVFALNRAFCKLSPPCNKLLKVHSLHQDVFVLIRYVLGS